MKHDSAGTRADSRVSTSRPPPRVLAENSPKTRVTVENRPLAVETRPLAMTRAYLALTRAYSVGLVGEGKSTHDENDIGRKRNLEIRFSFNFYGTRFFGDPSILSLNQSLTVEARLILRFW